MNSAQNLQIVLEDGLVKSEKITVESVEIADKILLFVIHSAGH